jgi:sterol desaturase/sphingolipid hydroxylase (fatty acid hydroxylase superfamily)
MDAIYIILAIPVFILSILVELAYDRYRRTGLYNFADSISCLSCGVGQQILLPLTGMMGLSIYQSVQSHLGLFTIPQTALWAWAVMFLIDDFLYYLYHWGSHRVNILWATHAVHHQSEEYNLSVALRQSWFTSLTSWVFYLPLALLGFPLVMFVIVRTFNTLYQFWIHTRAIGKLGFLESFLNTPSHHRVHHGINPKYIDRNHAGILIIWDKLLGTFQVEEEEPVYGTVKPLASFNPVWANFAELERLWDISRRTKRLRDKIWIWFAPPEWHPADHGGVVVVPQVSRTSQQKYQVSPPLTVSLYTVQSFTSLLAASTLFIYIAHRLSLPLQLLFIAHLVVGLATCSAIEEGKPWARSVELIRFVALLGVLPLIPAAYQLAVVLAVVVQLTLFGLLWRGKSLSVDQASPL